MRSTALLPLLALCYTISALPISTGTSTSTLDKRQADLQWNDNSKDDDFSVSADILGEEVHIDKKKKRNIIFDQVDTSSVKACVDVKKRQGNIIFDQVQSLGNGANNCDD